MSAWLLGLLVLVLLLLIIIIITILSNIFLIISTLASCWLLSYSNASRALFTFPRAFLPPHMTQTPSPPLPPPQSSFYLLRLLLLLLLLLLVLFFLNLFIDMFALRNLYKKRQIWMPCYAPFWHSIMSQCYATFTREVFFFLSVLIWIFELEV